MNGFGKNAIIWAVIFMALLTLYQGFGSDLEKKGDEVSYSQFLAMVEAQQISKVDIQGNTLTGTSTTGESIKTLAPYDPNLVEDLRKSAVDIQVQAKDAGRPILVDILISWFPMFLLIAVWVFFMRQMQGGKGGGAMSFGKSRARMLSEHEIKITFDDVAGVEEAKQELEEVVDFLKDPGKFQKLGGKIPKGVLLVGPPGTGKTLLARSVAGEAGVPFFTISGSDFVEMFVGVGASRVRDLFEQGKKNAPCIIFIDEIDAVGRHRGAGIGGGNDEREQTLNQLLVEMDGFGANEGVILIAATNRPDVLDSALMRPGRFDRQVVVPLPDIRGRKQILTVHMKKVPLGTDVDAEVIARGTPGFSGADLANLVNEAALMAARASKRLVDMEDFEMAKDKVMMGAERRSAAMTEEQKKTTAYHEAGHAIVTHFIEGEKDPLHKVTIIPRGRALGVTMSLPAEDKVTYDKAYLENQIAILMGGRLAEELILGQMTTGASNDIERATELAQNMVCSWGMSAKMGPLSYGAKGPDPFSRGGSSSGASAISDKLAAEIDAEVRNFVESNYERAKKLLQKHDKELHMLSEALLEYETLDLGQIEELFAGKKITLKKESRRRKKVEASKKAAAAETETAVKADQAQTAAEKVLSEVEKEADISQDKAEKSTTSKAKTKKDKADK